MRGLQGILVPSRTVFGAVTLSAICCGRQNFHSKLPLLASDWWASCVPQITPHRALGDRGTPVTGSHLCPTKHLPLNSWVS